MPTINQLPTATQLSGGDQIPVYLPNAGDARRASLTTLSSWLGDNLDISSGDVSFIQAGAGAVATNVQTKLRETVSVFDFMDSSLAARIASRASTSSDASATTAAINAALASQPNAAIYFPPGWYDVNDTFRMQTSGRVLYCDAQSLTLIRQRTANIDTFVFGPPISGSFLSGCQFRNISISHANVVNLSTLGAGVRFVRCSNYEFYGAAVNDAVEGLVIEGGQFGSLKSFRLFSATGSLKTGNTALLHFKEANLGGGSFQPCYTVNVEDFRISTNQLRES
jgi:hypothetical protein